MSRPRIRSFKPDCWSDDAISPLSRDARLLFAVLVTFADDDGRFRDLPAQIIGHGYPEDDDVNARKVNAWVSELVGAGVVVRYTVDDRHYGTFPNWHTHQRINRYTPSSLPPCPRTPGVVIVQHPSHDKPRETSLNAHGEISEVSRSDQRELTKTSPPDRKGRDRSGVQLAPVPSSEPQFLAEGSSGARGAA